VGKLLGRIQMKIEEVKGPLSEINKDCIRMYESQGYEILKEFPNEYILMYNHSTTEKVRIYNSNRSYHGHKIWEGE
jgi:hypothetical protein